VSSREDDCLEGPRDESLEEGRGGKSSMTERGDQGREA